MNVTAFEHYSTTRNRAYALAFLGSGALFTVATTNTSYEAAIATLLALLGTFVFIAISYINRLITYHWKQLKTLLNHGVGDFPELADIVAINKRYMNRRVGVSAHAIMALLAASACWVPAIILFFDLGGNP